MKVPAEVPMVVHVVVLVPMHVPRELFVVDPILVLLLSSQHLCAHEVPVVHPVLVVASSLPVPHPLHHLHLPIPTLSMEFPMAL